MDMFAETCSEVLANKDLVTDGDIVQTSGHTSLNSVTEIRPDGAGWQVLAPSAAEEDPEVKLSLASDVTVHSLKVTGNVDNVRIEITPRDSSQLPEIMDSVSANSIAFTDPVEASDVTVTLLNPRSDVPEGEQQQQQQQKPDIYNVRMEINGCYEQATTPAPLAESTTPLPPSETTEAPTVTTTLPPTETTKTPSVPPTLPPSETTEAPSVPTTLPTSETTKTPSVPTTLPPTGTPAVPYVPRTLPPVETTKAPSVPTTLPPTETTEAPSVPTTLPPTENTKTPSVPTTLPPTETTAAPTHSYSCKTTPEEQTTLGRTPSLSSTTVGVTTVSGPLTETVTTVQYSSPTEPGVTYTPELRNVTAVITTASVQESTAATTTSGVSTTPESQDVTQEEDSCFKRTMNLTMEVEGCVSDGPVELAFCAGSCASNTTASFTYPFFETNCHCCKPTKVSWRTVQLTCANNEVRQHTYVKIHSCGCHGCEYDAYAASGITQVMTSNVAI
ncbi:mucin-2-like [Liolophura sinensis]|uniref:mucin-2-like n=1 Tax=Liolophura sinensis TaxID=3198878 RepID=UPI003158937B